MATNRRTRKVIHVCHMANCLPGKLGGSPLMANCSHLAITVVGREMSSEQPLSVCFLSASASCPRFLPQRRACCVCSYHHSCILKQVFISTLPRVEVEHEGALFAKHQLFRTCRHHASHRSLSALPTSPCHPRLSHQKAP